MEPMEYLIKGPNIVILKFKDLYEMGQWLFAKLVLLFLSHSNVIFDMHIDALNNNNLGKW